MKKLVAVMLACFLLIAPAMAGGNESPLPDTDRLPGVDLAEGFSQITGTAISPLLGVSVVGAWKYYSVPAASRAQLPWFSSPWVWGTGFSVLFLLAASGAITSFAPGLSKVVKLVDVVEDKASALLASTTVVPLIAVQMAKYELAGPSVALSDMQMASALSIGQVGVAAFLVVVAMAVFLVVWLANHAINVLILLSPFAIVDGALRLSKGLLFVLIMGLAALSPVLALAICVVLVGVSWWVAPWAFRLTVFGTVLSFDILFSWAKKAQIRASAPHVFLAAPIGRVAVRTYGHIERATDDSVWFVYRPWLILRKRRVALPSGRRVVSKGLLFPSLATAPEGSEKYRDTVSLLPRYRGSENLVATELGIVEVRENILRRGLAAIRGWISATFGTIRRALPGTGA